MAGCNFTIALDAATGKELWRTEMGDIHLGQTMTMAPLVVKDKVIVGNSGGEMGVRGFAAALDVNTGKVVWKAYSVGPDKDVLIGAKFKTLYDQYIVAKISELAAGPAICGSTAVAQFGSGLPMIPT
jgi:alcohol dehydrogenase (cytochrome c)